ncbi:MAG: RlmE family RNA methyltransferase [Henriciella sp.]|nr:RlmE family RNA methyltransferase [Henriciella sp.]
MSDDGKRRWRGPGKDRKPDSGRRTGERKIIAYRAKSESSKKWIERQLADPYVQKARQDGYRARAAYKLLEIDEKAGLLKPGQRVVDLGSAPGGWLQVCVRKGVKELVGIDLLEVEPVVGAHVVQGDINNPADVEAMLAGLSGPPDLVLSDMAANTTGHRQTDHLRTAALADMALHFATENLVQGGAFCSKVFQGGATPDMMEALRARFRTVKHIKPPASRSGSPELFVVATGFLGKQASTQ